MALFTEVQHLCNFYRVPPLFTTFFQMFGMCRTPSVRTSLLMFLTDRTIARISSSPVLYQVPRSGSFKYNVRTINSYPRRVANKCFRLEETRLLEKKKTSINKQHFNESCSSSRFGFYDALNISGH